MPALRGVDFRSCGCCGNPNPKSIGDSLDLKLAIIRDLVAGRRVAAVAGKTVRDVVTVGDSAVQSAEGHHQLAAEAELRSPALLQRFGSSL